MSSHFVRLTLEELEPRVVLAAYTFTEAVSDAWNNVQNWLVGGVVPVLLPGPQDTTDVPLNTTADLSGTPASVMGLKVEGKLTAEEDLTVGMSGTAIGFGGSLLVGNSDDPAANPEFKTTTFGVAPTSTATIGGPAAGSAGTLDASNTVTVSGTLNIGSAGAGKSGDVDATGLVAVTGTSAVVTVGGSGGSGGTLDVQTLTTTSGGSSANLVVNSAGKVEVKNSASLSGTTLVPGGVIEADQIDGFTGANVTFYGAADITSGPIDGNLTAQSNASFTFAPGSAVDLDTGATLGDGKFYVDGPLTVDGNLTLNKPDFFLQNNRTNSAGSIGGSGSIDWWNNDFEWDGGTISLAGGFTIDANSEFKLLGPDAKTLSTTLTNLGSGTADFDGGGTLTIMAGGLLDNQATSILPMEAQLPVIAGPGIFENEGTFEDASSNLTISAVLKNESDGAIDCTSTAGTLTLSDTSGGSLLDGKIGLDDASLLLSGVFTTDASFEEEFSANDETTLTGTLTINSGANADFDHLVFGASGVSATVAGAGELAVGPDGTNTGDYLKWIDGVMSGGGLTIGPLATLYLTGTGTESRNVDNLGAVDWSDGSTVTFGDGTEVHTEKGGLFDFENSLGGTVPTFTNDGTLEVTAGDTMTAGTFTQSSTGTLQSDMSSDSSYGVLGVTGTATLDGTLQAQLENGYQPVSGTSFKVLTFGSSSGQFATVSPNGWSAQYDPTDVELIAG